MVVTLDEGANVVRVAPSAHSLNVHAAHASGLDDLDATFDRADTLRHIELQSSSVTTPAVAPARGHLFSWDRPHSQPACSSSAARISRYSSARRALVSHVSGIAARWAMSRRTLASACSTAVPIMVSGIATPVTPAACRPRRRFGRRAGLRGFSYP